MENLRIFDILDRMQQKFPKEDCLAGKENGKWRKYSTQEYCELAREFSLGILAYGLDKGDRIATISNNRPEWNIADMGMAQVGVVHVPIYPTISTEDYEYILGHCKPKMLIVSDKSLYDKLKPIIDKQNCDCLLFSYNRIEGVANWQDIISKGKRKEKDCDADYQILRNSISPDDLATIIYTSGTTGFPKGVMLSHKSIMTNVQEAAKVTTLEEDNKTLSFLPLCHIYERMVNYHFQFKGMSVYYAENMGTIVENIKDVKPDIFNSVPRLLERVYDKILAKGRDLKGVKKAIFFWAVKVAHDFDYDKNLNSWYGIKRKVADKLVYSKWRDALGGNIKIIVSGGAALQPRLASIFGAAGIFVLEGYGLTETSPVIAVNNYTTREIKIGTVGPVLPSVKVKIAEDGEILVKGPSVMLGYYNAPDLTAEVIDKEGWFHTGDIGTLVDDKYLKITDRKKEIFKLSSGKYIAPQVIENKFKEACIIEQLMVIGENEKFASAIISPDFDCLHNWASQHKVHYRDNADLIKQPEVIALFQKTVNNFNKELGQTEHIKRYKLVSEEWTPNNGMLSPTLKLKRRVVSDFYKKIIEEIYDIKDSIKEKVAQEV